MTAEYPHLGRMLWRSDLAELPPPEPLIKGVLNLRSYVIMPGQFGTNKSFAALGMAYGVVTGLGWLGREAPLGPTPVIYVVGEGAYGLNDRLAALEEAHEQKIPNAKFRVLMLPSSLMDGDFWADLRRCARKMKARLVVFDTQSSLAPDADETADAPKITRQMSNLAIDIDGCSLLLHHTGWKDTDRSRGGSQFEGNADDVWVMQNVGPDPADTVQTCLWLKKAKERPNGTRIYLQRVAVGDSCVLEETFDVSPAQTFVSDELIDAYILDYVGDHPYQDTETSLRGVVAKAMKVGDQRVRGRIKKLLVNDRLVTRDLLRADGGAVGARKQTLLGLPDSPIPASAREADPAGDPGRETRAGSTLNRRRRTRRKSPGRST